VGETSPEFSPTYQAILVLLAQSIFCSVMMHSFLISLFAELALSTAITCNPSLWQPPVGIKWQIIISNNISVDTSAALAPVHTPVWDIDLFNTPSEVIEDLQDQGIKVICYFSAGTGENWRPDYGNFSSTDLGDSLGCWPGESYLNIRSDSVWAVMQERIRLADDKGCNAIDPDNMGLYSMIMVLLQPDKMKTRIRTAGEASISQKMIPSHISRSSLRRPRNTECRPASRTQWKYFPEYRTRSNLPSTKNARPEGIVLAMTI
jgi:hypothetical protein